MFIAADFWLGISCAVPFVIFLVWVYPRFLVHLICSTCKKKDGSENETTSNSDSNAITISRPDEISEAHLNTSAIPMNTIDVSVVLLFTARNEKELQESTREIHANKNFFLTSIPYFAPDP